MSRAFAGFLIRASNTRLNIQLHALDPEPTKISILRQVRTCYD